MVYLLHWMMIVGLSLAVSLWVFLWALRTGQFSDQARARYLPLRDQSPHPSSAEEEKRPIEVYVLLAIAGCGVLGMAAPILLSLLRMKG